MTNDDDKLEYQREIFLDGVIDALNAVKEGQSMVFFFPIQEGRDRFMMHTTQADGTELELSLEIRRRLVNVA